MGLEGEKEMQLGTYDDITKFFDSKCNLLTSEFENIADKNRVKLTLLTEKKVTAEVYSEFLAKIKIEVLAVLDLELKDSEGNVYNPENKVFTSDNDSGYGESKNTDGAIDSLFKKLFEKQNDYTSMKNQYDNVKNVLDKVMSEDNNKDFVIKKQLFDKSYISLITAIDTMKTITNGSIKSIKGAMYAHEMIKATVSLLESNVEEIEFTHPNMKEISLPFLDKNNGPSNAH